MEVLRSDRAPVGARPFENHGDDAVHRPDQDRLRWQGELVYLGPHRRPRWEVWRPPTHRALSRARARTCGWSLELRDVGLDALLGCVASLKTNPNADRSGCAQVAALSAFARSRVGLLLDLVGGAFGLGYGPARPGPAPQLPRPAA